jgi:hypothetical protein
LLSISDPKLNSKRAVFWAMYKLIITIASQLVYMLIYGRLTTISTILLYFLSQYHDIQGYRSIFCSFIDFHGDTFFSSKKMQLNYFYWLVLLIKVLTCLCFPFGDLYLFSIRRINHRFLTKLLRRFI